MTLCENLTCPQGNPQATHKVKVQNTGEEVQVCRTCASMYKAGAPVDYKTKKGKP